MTFVVLEGLDGSGKSTQTKRLAEELGLKATAEPTEGPVGTLIRGELSRGDLEPEILALLFAADLAGRKE
ncbi:MAG: Thymidylate kinase [Methanonatronarchaeales archaeon]|nr:Thymidylate kinase [Methanonatronarchaeales archaeon]